MIEIITEFKPIKPTWHYTEKEPEQDEECFCDAGEFFGYRTLIYDGDVFYNSDGQWFEVTRWARVSEIVIALNKNI